ncbi:hypothetical protein DW842_20370 [Ruminococcus sp. AM36-17]|nr:hypothetical protein DW842_20370 [Ruminococcus sp. AM36-17]
MKVCTCGSSTEKPAKSMQKVVVVYILYVPKIFVKSVYVKYQIFGSPYTKNVYTYIHKKMRHRKKCIHLYIHSGGVNKMHILVSRGKQEI